ncbi:regulator of sigma E protease [Caulobacter ginsengisoli]|uniref:Regulator of sigma E protease n=1 Tax=Caulobacter ginsengisoli TaxID=400775 RepID=A0ABU0IM33_9CAUL|nr:M50 family metallopeptidase [Caulobacter ginsengisoli]MDQ0463024.1 regulator of sigma E protease [Caulobacter ginsengisoli]
MHLLQNIFLFIVPFLLVITVVVTVHEFGHFLMAKRFGVAIDRFSIGFGRAVFARTDRDGVEWRIGWLPLGGYVRFAGDENAASVPDKEDLESLREHIVEEQGAAAVSRYYHFKPVWQRALIAVAGPSANFALAILLFAGLAMVFGQVRQDARVGSVEPGSVAATVGFKSDDLILSMDGRPVRDFSDLPPYVGLRTGVPIRFEVQRGDQLLNITATPRKTTIEDKVAGRHTQGLLGLNGPLFKGPYTHHVRYNPIEAVGVGVNQTWRTVATTSFYLGRLITGKTSPDQLSGMIGMANATSALTKESVEGTKTFGQAALSVSANLLALIAFLSVGIGFMNLMPIPVLDGGHLVFYAYEAVARRPLAASIQAVGYRLGLALLVGFMLFAGWNDLHRYDVFKKLGELLF